MGEGRSCGQRQGGFPGPAGQFCSKHQWKVPLYRGQGFKPARRVAPVPANRGPRRPSAFPGRGQLAQCDVREAGVSRTGRALPQWVRVRSPSGARSGTESSRTDGQTDQDSP